MVIELGWDVIGEACHVRFMSAPPMLPLPYLPIHPSITPLSHSYLTSPLPGVPVCELFV